MGKLSDAQARFTFMLAQLILFAFYNGYRLRILCAKCAKQGHHRKQSLHYDGLAVDFALDIKIDGKWVYQTTTRAYKEIGEFWESIGGTWGGRFQDGNHFSHEYNGRM